MDTDHDETYGDRVHDTAAGYMNQGMSEEAAYEQAIAEEPRHVE